MLININSQICHLFFCNTKITLFIEPNNLFPILIIRICKRNMMQYNYICTCTYKEITLLYRKCLSVMIVEVLKDLLSIENIVFDSV